MEEMDERVHYVNLIKGIIKPKEEFAGLREADRIIGLGWQLTALSVVNAIVGYITTRMLYALDLVPDVSSQLQGSEAQMGQEATKMMAGAGAIFGGLVGPVVIMLIMALIFLIFFSEIGFKKLFTIELYLQFITLISSVVSLIFVLIFRENVKDVLSLGSFTKLFTHEAFVTAFFSGISIFLIWKLYVQITAYHQASSKSPSSVMWTLIILNIVFLLISGGFAVLGEQLQDLVKQMGPGQIPKQ